MPTLVLSPQERSALRAAAHALRPVVLIGDRGLSPAVQREVDVNLKAHGLIKVRVAGDDREARLAILAELCESLSCAPVNHLGKILTLYRPLPEPEPAAPVRRRAAPRLNKKKAAARADRA